MLAPHIRLVGLVEIGESAPNNPHGSDEGQSKIDSDKSTDGSAGHQREHGQKRMHLQFVTHHAWRDEVTRWRIVPTNAN